MNELNSHITESAFTKGGFFKNVKAEIVTPKSKEELIDIINDTIAKEGPNCDLNFINTSKIVDMSELFQTTELSKFNGDISKWNVSKVEYMNRMFDDSKFNGDISKWNVSNVKDMTHMFANSDFEGDISKWNVSKVIYKSHMFDDSSLEKLNKLPDWYK